MKTLFIILVLIHMCGSASGQLLTYDAVNHASNALYEIKNVVLWAETQVQAAETQLNTLNTYENTVLQVERMGDPKNLPRTSLECRTCRHLSTNLFAGMKDVKTGAPTRTRNLDL